MRTPTAGLFCCAGSLLIFVLAVQFVSDSSIGCAQARPAVKTLPPPKAVTMIDWNIQVGSDKGLFRNGWKQRKRALIAILSRERPDILCVQEAQKEQIDYIIKEMPGYSYLGVGRDDGKTKGEHCAIFYTKRMEILDEGTFWLSETPSSPEKTWDGIFRRIVTWARVRDRVSTRKFCVFNTHFPVLSATARIKSAEVLLKQIFRICPRGRFLLAGDFNCRPGSAPWKAIKRAGFTDAEWLVTHNEQRSKTYHVAGSPSECLDAIFVSKDIRVLKHEIIDDRVGNIYPSDHFGTKIEFAFSSRD